MTGTSMFTVGRLLSSWVESHTVTLEPKETSIEDGGRLLEFAAEAD